MPPASLFSRLSKKAEPQHARSLPPLGAQRPPGRQQPVAALNKRYSECANCPAHAHNGPASCKRPCPSTAFFFCPTTTWRITPQARAATAAATGALPASPAPGSTRRAPAPAGRGKNNGPTCAPQSAASRGSGRPAYRPASQPNSLRPEFCAARACSRCIWPRPRVLSAARVACRSAGRHWRKTFRFSR